MIINGHPRIWPCYECGERKQIDYMTLIPTGERENRVDYVCDDCKLSATRKHYAREAEKAAEYVKAEDLKVDADGLITGEFA